MIRLRTGIGAFLYNSGNVLLMKRSAHKRIAPNVWVGVGGHMEPHELNHPSETTFAKLPKPN